MKRAPQAFPIAFIDIKTKNIKIEGLPAFGLQPGQSYSAIDLLGWEQWSELELELLRSGMSERSITLSAPNGLWELYTASEIMFPNTIKLQCLRLQQVIPESLPLQIQASDAAFLRWLNLQPKQVRYHSRLDGSCLTIGCGRNQISLYENEQAVFDALPQISEYQVINTGNNCLCLKRKRIRSNMKILDNGVNHSWLGLVPEHYQGWASSNAYWLEELQYSATVAVQELTAPYRWIALLPWRGVRDRLNRQAEDLVGQDGGMDLLDPGLRETRLQLLSAIDQHGSASTQYTHDWYDPSYPVRPSWVWEFELRGRKIPGTDLALISVLDGPDPLTVARQQDWWLTREKIKAA